MKMKARMIWKMGCRPVRFLLQPSQPPKMVHGHAQRGLGHGPHRTVAGSNLKQRREYEHKVSEEYTLRRAHNEGLCRREH